MQNIGICCYYMYLLYEYIKINYDITSSRIMNNLHNCYLHNKNVFVNVISKETCNASMFNN